jgi:putative DNA primase/helicase
MYNQVRFIVNANELPKEVEQTEAYFRRYLIIPFDVTIPECDRDSELAKKIIGEI